MKYRCLVFDHDDTTVDSTASIHYPSFLAYMSKVKPDLKISLQEYVKYNFDPGVLEFFSEICGLNPQQMIEEQEFWKDFASKHYAKAFDGIKEIMKKQKQQGGLIAVVSHSLRENILKDYRYNQLPIPDLIFGWEQPAEERKPSPIPLFTIMEQYHLQPEQILVIDDLKPGYDMAKAAKVDFAAAGWCFDIAENKRFMLEKADYYCESVEQLKKICFEE